MNTDEFWTIIDDVNARAGGDVLLKEEALSDSLSKREAADIHAFAGHLDRLRGQAYTWPLWAAVGRCGPPHTSFKAAAATTHSWIFDAASCFRAGISTSKYAQIRNRSRCWTTEH